MLVLSFVSLMAAASKHKSNEVFYDANVMGCTWQGEAPVLCPQSEHWSIAHMRTSATQFVELWKRRPPGENTGGMNTNHAFALWYATFKLQPEYIIESGIFKGFGTWLMRQAAPNATIICLDPNPTRNMMYVDPTGTYLTGDKFVDFGKVQWQHYIPRRSLMKTFVMFDCHMDALRRVREMRSFGFIHLFYEDNVAARGGNYAFTQMCSDKEWTTASVPKVEPVQVVDNFGTKTELISLAQHKKNVAELNSYLAVYFEMPALYDGCPDKGRQTSIFHDFQRLRKLGFEKEEGWQRKSPWDHLYPPYVQLKPTKPAHSLLGSWFG